MTTSKNEEKKVEVNPFLFRYPPNTRFTNGAFKEQCPVQIVKDDFGDSITDKESYRLSLASKRGAIGSGSMQSGVYMFPDGKYNPDKDYSTLFRSDLSIVQIDEMITKLQSELKDSDGILKEKIESEIKAAKELKDKKELETNTNDIKPSE